MIILNKAIKKIFEIAGLKLSRIENASPIPLTQQKFELLFDVGANTGQYAQARRKGGYKGQIVSFEPLPEAYEILTHNSHSDLLWSTHHRCAIGASPGEAEINISQNSASSSLRPMLHAHSSAAPESVYIGKAKTEVITLDSIFSTYRRNQEKTFLKIDTQGFESEVLKGVEGNLRNISAVQLELSTIPLYEGQNLYKYFFDFFEENDFILWSLIPGFANRSTGQLLQFDAVFVRQS